MGAFLERTIHGRPEEKSIQVAPQHAAFASRVEDDQVAGVSELRRIEASTSRLRGLRSL
jgi:hypothetical protein